MGTEEKKTKKERQDLSFFSQTGDSELGNLLFIFPNIKGERRDDGNTPAGRTDRGWVGY
jgi:hypothetical protein